MNATRRKSLSSLIERISAIDIDAVISDLETLRDEEQDYYDNMPESFQASERGGMAEVAVSAMDDAISVLEDARSAMEDAINNIEAAAE